MTPVKIRVSNKRAYIWEVNDIAILRSQHRICGILNGTLPHLSQQNLFLGPPLSLMPEEVVLLLENNLAVLVDDPKAHLPPTEKQISEWKAQQRDSKLQQLLLQQAKEADTSVLSRSMSQDAIRKRQEREAKKRAAAAALAPVDESLHTPLPTEPSKPAVPQYNVLIPATSSDLSWYSPDTCVYSTLDEAREAGIWDYPSSLHERAKCGVFRGLWDQGYFLGRGITFGGDYLVYPGDPLRYHSHFSATVVDSPTYTINPMEIVAHGRLGTATKKSHLLCGWDDITKQVSFLSIEWAGFG